MVLDVMPFAHDQFRFIGILLHLAADDEKLSFYVFVVQRLQNIFKRFYRRGPIIKRQHDLFALAESAIARVGITRVAITCVPITRFVMMPCIIARFVMSRFVMSRFVMSRFVMSRFVIRW